MDKSLLFILFLVLWLVFNFLKAGKKKQAPPPPVTSDAEEGDDMQKEDKVEEMLKKIFGAEEYKPIEPPEPPKHVPVAEQTAMEEYQLQERLESLSEQYEREKYNNSIIDNKNKKEEIKQSVTKKRQKEKKHEFDIGFLQKEHFDLKKAILYSAILERPYK